MRWRQEEPGDHESPGAVGLFSCVYVRSRIFGLIDGAKSQTISKFEMFEAVKAPFGSLSAAFGASKQEKEEVAKFLLPNLERALVLESEEAFNAIDRLFEDSVSLIRRPNVGEEQ